MASVPEPYKHRIEHIYCLEDRLENLSEVGEVDLSNYALANHTHSGYASTNHTHSGYALSSHSHDNYAITGHTHSNYASTNHTHSGYASTNHTHSDYACAGHTHEGFALCSHTHNGYASCAHDHDSVYSKLGHTHPTTDYSSDICKLKCAIRTLDTYLSTIFGPLEDKNCASFYAFPYSYTCGGQSLLQRNGFSDEYYGTIPSPASTTSHENTIISE